MRQSNMEQHRRALIDDVCAERDRLRSEIEAMKSRETLLLSELHTRAKEIEAMREIVSEVACGGVEFEDIRVRYVALQVDRDIWLAARRLAAAREGKE